MKEGKWIKAELMGSELRSKRIGVVGAAGRIGLEVAYCDAGVRRNGGRVRCD